MNKIQLSSMYGHMGNGGKEKSPVHDYDKFINDYKEKSIDIKNNNTDNKKVRKNNKI